MTILRKLFAHERQEYSDHLTRLSGLDRYARFTGVVSDEAIRRRVAGMDWTRTIVIGAFRDGRMVGAAELSGETPLWRGGPVELAVSIEPEHQGDGLGSALVRRAMTVARNRRLSPVTMICLVENTRMQRIVSGLNGAMRVESGEVVGAVEPGVPSQASLLLEGFEDTASLFAGVADGLRSTVPVLLPGPALSAAPT